MFSCLQLYLAPLDIGCLMGKPRASKIMESLLFVLAAVGILISIVWVIFPFFVLDYLKSMNTHLKTIAEKSEEAVYWASKEK